MVINVTDEQREVPPIAYRTEWGQYDIPYPTDEPVFLPEGTMCRLSTRTHQGLTLVKLSALDFPHDNSLLWVSLNTNEVTNGKTDKRT